MEQRNEDEDFKNNVVTLILAVAVTLLFALLMSGCKTKVVTVPEVHTEYVARTDTMRLMELDSVLLRDSIFVDRWVSGDTVYQVKEVYRQGVRWRDRVVYRSATDTLLRVDTVSVVPAPVAAELTKSQRRYITIGKWACGVGVAVVAALIAVAVWWYRRKV